MNRRRARPHRRVRPHTSPDDQRMITIFRLVHRALTIIPSATTIAGHLSCYNPREVDSMANLGNVVQMLKKEHDRLTNQMERISAALAAFGSAYGKQTGVRRQMSASGRARIAAAQRARWAKLKAKRGKGNVVTLPKKRTLSAAARKKIASAQRARWARVKATKKTA